MPAKITKTSKLSGITRTIVIKQYDQDEFDKRMLAWQQKGILIQEALPDISASEREFILTGATDAEWDRYFGVGSD